MVWVVAREEQAGDHTVKHNKQSGSEPSKNSFISTVILCIVKCYAICIYWGFGSRDGHAALDFYADHVPSEHPGSRYNSGNTPSKAYSNLIQSGYF